MGVEENVKINLMELTKKHIPGDGFHMKIGQKENIHRLQTQGQLYCNHISYFTNKENQLDAAQNDIHENVVEIKRLKTNSIWLKPAKEPNTSFKRLPINEAKLLTTVNDIKANLFCLYTHFLPNEYEYGTPFKMTIPKGFTGDTCLFILNHHEFLHRVAAKLMELNTPFTGDFVNYKSFDQDFVEKSLFEKDLKYQDQNEYRLLIEGTSEGPFTFEIGDISDISFVLTIEEALTHEYMFELNELINKSNT